MANSWGLFGHASRACYELAQKRLTNAENLNKVIERADERTRTAYPCSLRVSYFCWRSSPHHTFSALGPSIGLPPRSR